MIIYKVSCVFLLNDVVMNSALQFVVEEVVCDKNIVLS
jgi:hypothetical protein